MACMPTYVVSATASADAIVLQLHGGKGARYRRGMTTLKYEGTNLHFGPRYTEIAATFVTRNTDKSFKFCLRSHG
jgi:hypothetical protein